MTTEKLDIYEKPKFKRPRLLMGFSDWMDGAEVSTGTIRYLVDKLGAEEFARISPDGFYIYNFPGMMEVTAMFRPHINIQEGLIKSIDFPQNLFFADEENDLILFLGKEPNINWEQYIDCLFTFCTRFNVEQIFFIGSVSGLVPHTRQPRLQCCVSKPKLKEIYKHYGVSFTDYDGPGSIVTFITALCGELNIDMVTFIATVPAYVQGNNPKCIEAVTHRILGILDIQTDIDDLRVLSEDFEKRLDELVLEQPELAENILKLEENYDNEIFNNEMGELKHWLQQKGIRLD